jgi:hypothetical protein
MVLFIDPPQVGAAFFRCAADVQAIDRPALKPMPME